MQPANTNSGKRDKAIAARRYKILEAAVACFLDTGYHQTGVRDIAARAGVSLGNLYNHFSGKHDVLVEIARLERMELEPFVTHLGKSGPAAQVLDRFVTNYAKYLSIPENVILTVEITSEAIRKEDLGTLFMDNRQALVDALADLLKRGVKQEEFRLCSEANNTARMVLDLIEAQAYHNVLGAVPMRKLLPDLIRFLNAALGIRVQ